MVYLPYVTLARDWREVGYQKEATLKSVPVTTTMDTMSLVGSGRRNSVVLGAHAIRARQYEQLSPFAAVFIDKLSIQYLGINNHGHDSGVVLADSPATMRRAVY
ncbi:hypothetical protein VPH35_001655 [Triticum aestivum]